MCMGPLGSFGACVLSGRTWWITQPSASTGAGVIGCRYSGAHPSGRTGHWIVGCCFGGANQSFVLSGSEECKVRCFAASSPAATGAQPCTRWRLAGELGTEAAPQCVRLRVRGGAVRAVHAASPGALPAARLRGGCAAPHTAPHRCNSTPQLGYLPWSVIRQTDLAMRCKPWSLPSFQQEDPLWKRPCKQPAPRRSAG